MKDKIFTLWGYIIVDNLDINIVLKSMPIGKDSLATIVKSKKSKNI